MEKKEPFVEGRGIFYALILILIFFSILVLLWGGIYFFRQNNNFYDVFHGQLARGFYLTAIFILLGSSVAYAPFSFGISYYFLNLSEGRARFWDLFFLFRAPLLLFKAIFLSVVKKILIYGERLLILLGAALLEVILFFCFLVVRGEDIFAVEGSPFAAAADFMLRSPWLIGLSVLLWSGVLLMMFLSYLRYILCKYVMLEYEDVSIFQAVRVGRDSIKHHFFATFRFYFKYIATLILKTATLGRVPKGPIVGFSTYARKLVKEGWRAYCKRRSR